MQASAATMADGDGDDDGDDDDDDDDAIEHDGNDGGLLRQRLVQASEVMASISSLARNMHTSVAVSRALLALSSLRAAFRALLPERRTRNHVARHQVLEACKVSFAMMVPCPSKSLCGRA